MVDVMDMHQSWSWNNACCLSHSISYFAQMRFFFHQPVPVLSCLTTCLTHPPPVINTPYTTIYHSTVFSFNTNLNGEMKRLWTIFDSMVNYSILLFKLITIQRLIYNTRQHFSWSMIKKRKWPADEIDDNEIMINYVMV